MWFVCSCICPCVCVHRNSSDALIQYYVYDFRFLFEGVKIDMILFEFKNEIGKSHEKVI